MLVIVIEDLKLRINNPNLLIGKSAIYFDPSFQKESDDRNSIFITIFYLCLFKFSKP